MDPDALTVTVLELRDGLYVEQAVAVCDEECRVERPFRVRIVPGRLLD